MPRLRCFGLGLMLALAPWERTSAQGAGPHVGAEAEYFFLIGHWRSPLESGPGGAAFVGYGRGGAAIRLGAALTFHHEDFATADLSGASPGSPGATRRIERFFGELRYAPPGRPLVLLESMGVRLARLHARSLVTPWAWHYEALASSSIPFGPRPEVVGGVGGVRFPEENLPRPRTAHSARIGIAFALRPRR